jgi:hypothetical protein
MHTAAVFAIYSRSLAGLAIIAFGPGVAPGGFVEGVFNFAVA